MAAVWPYISNPEVIHGTQPPLRAFSLPFLNHSQVVPLAPQVISVNQVSEETLKKTPPTA